MTYTTKWDEDTVLDYLYLMARDRSVDRLALLRQLADVRLSRPSDWDTKAMRVAAAELRAPWRVTPPKGNMSLLPTEQCWSCLSCERRIYWHHVITIGHGGSSTPRNLVPLCHRCHRDVHPWLPEPTSMENVRGWTALKDIAGRAIDRIAKIWTAKQAEPPVFF